MTKSERKGCRGHAGGRMTQAKHPFEDKSVAYALDDAGNIVTETDFRYGYSNNKLASRQPLPVGTAWNYNNDVLRVGWSWRGSVTGGYNSFGIRLGSRRGPIHWHFPIV